MHIGKDCFRYACTLNIKEIKTVFYVNLLVLFLRRLSEVQALHNPIRTPLSLFARPCVVLQLRWRLLMKWKTLSQRLASVAVVHGNLSLECDNARHYHGQIMLDLIAAVVDSTHRTVSSTNWAMQTYRRTGMGMSWQKKIKRNGDNMNPCGTSSGGGVYSGQLTADPRSVLSMFMNYDPDKSHQRHGWQGAYEEAARLDQKHARYQRKQLLGIGLRWGSWWRVCENEVRGNWHHLEH